MLKWLQEHLRILLIIYLAEGGVMALAGIVLLIISSVYGLYPAVGGGLLFLGLAQFFVGVWLFKRRGKGLLG